MARYIEFDSTYRDRNRYPLPGDFVIELSQSGMKDRINALDPISKSAPNLIFSPNDFLIGGGLTITGNVDSFAPNIGTVSDETVFVVSITAGLAHKESYYYTGCIITNTALSTYRRIVGWKYLNTSGGLDRFLVTIDRNFPDTFASGNAISISNPTDFSDLTNPLIFLPMMQNLGEDYYIEYIMYNQTLNEYANILEYDGFTRVAKLGPVVSAWLKTHTYVLRESPPSEFGTTVSGTTNSIVLPLTSSSIQGFYNGSFLRITSGASSDEIRRIVSYNSTTKTVAVSPPFSSAIGANTYEILPFFTDNYSPFIYTGSSLAQQEVACYEIELINLILPNRTLGTGKGNRIAFYPYIYLELESLSGSSSGNRNILYSNNPNSTKVLFRIPIDDIATPLLTPFINLGSDSMKQTVKFNPNDSFRLTVKLSNGEIFRTKDIDTVGPLRPDCMLQLSAVFSIKRVIKE